MKVYSPTWPVDYVDIESCIPQSPTKPILRRVLEGSTEYHGLDSEFVTSVAFVSGEIYGPYYKYRVYQDFDVGYNLWQCDTTWVRGYIDRWPKTLVLGSFLYYSEL